MSSATWDAVLAALGEFEMLVLTGRDAAGFPVSLRCRPEPDHATRILRVRPPAWFDAQAGPASLMGHSHDAQLWNLRSFLARGTLQPGVDGLVFRPVSWTGTPRGVRGTLRTLLGTRRAAAGYLRRRGLPRPTVPWDTIKAAKRALS
jgi:hypothetical protein